MQVCPAAAKMPATRPLAAAVRSASGKTMLADLPPSSRVAGARCPAAERATAAPVTSEPGNDTVFRVGVPDQPLADLAGAAADGVEHAGRESRLGEQLGQQHDR